MKFRHTVLAILALPLWAALFCHPFILGCVALISGGVRLHGIPLADLAILVFTARLSWLFVTASWGEARVVVPGLAAFAIALLLYPLGLWIALSCALIVADLLPESANREAALIDDFTAKERLSRRILQRFGA